MTNKIGRPKKNESICKSTSKMRDYNEARILCMNAWLAEHSPDEVLKFCIKHEMDTRQITYLLKRCNELKYMQTLNKYI